MLRQSFEIRLGAVIFSRYNGNVNGGVTMTRAAVIKEFFRWERRNVTTGFMLALWC